MKTFIQTCSPTNSQHSFDPEAEMEFSSLFEQCGIPLTELDGQIFPCHSSVMKDATMKWYTGTAPKEGDLVELEASTMVHGCRASKTMQRSSLDTSVDHTAEAPHDGSGSDTVSHLRVDQPIAPADSVSQFLELQAGKRVHEDPVVRTGAQRLDASSSSSLSGRSADVKRPSSPRSPLHSSAGSGQPNPTGTATTPSGSRTARKMDLYAHQQYYNGAQLSSPISMQSSPGDDPYLYASDIPPRFNQFLGHELASSTYGDSEAMRRSVSTPFLGARTSNSFHNLATEEFSLGNCQDFSSLDQVVPASDNDTWNGHTFSRSRPYQVQTSALSMSLNTVRPAMKRKSRPIPIATSMPRSTSMMAPHTAPLERCMVPHQLERPPLSSKRSFEDFNEIVDGQVDTPSYRHIATPKSKKPRSYQDQNGSIPASPFNDEPLFSPMYNGLALAMDPEQLLLSSPPYSQTDFCSSPGYLIQQSGQESMGDYLVPNSLHRQAYLYNNTDPLSPADLDGMWSQKPVIHRPAHLSAKPVHSIPRTIDFNLASPLRKVTNKSRRISAARAISFCNYTAADKKTILSGVAPSGSNKKVVSKAQDMSRSRSSSAIAV